MECRCDRGTAALVLIQSPLGPIPACRILHPAVGTGEQAPHFLDVAVQTGCEQLHPRLRPEHIETKGNFSACPLVRGPSFSLASHIAVVF